MANKKDLATGLIGTAINTSATTLVLQSGYGASMPAVPFFLTLTPAGQLSTLGNSEIVQVTARSTDTLTIVRAQKGTTAKSFSVGDIAANGVYTDDITEILAAIYPVGSVYVSGSSTMPSLISGLGTWVRVNGRVIVGVDESQTEFNTVDKTGGHKLMQTHRHFYSSESTVGIASAWGGIASTLRPTGTGYTLSLGTSDEGGGDSQNLQPYKTKYMWERTA